MSLDGSLSGICYDIFVGIAEGVRSRGLWGLEVRIPISGSIQNKFLGLTGRTPSLFGA